MRRFLNVGLIICAGICATIVCASAQTARQNPNGKPATDVTTAKAGATTTTAGQMIDELSGLLPASDFIAVIDAGRAFNDLLPRLAALNISDLDEMIKEANKFTSKTGIDLSKAKYAALGLRINGKEINGAAVVSGLDLDEKGIEAAMKAYKGDYRATEYNGSWIYITPSGGAAPDNDDETAYASLGRQKLVIGDLSAVKSVIDIHSGAAKGGVSPEMVAALKETGESALVRFTLNFLESWRQEILKQDGFIKSIASIKMILGTLDTENDLSMSLDAVLRTASQGEASELEGGLKALVSLIGGYLSSDPKLRGFGQLLDLIKIGSKQNDVSLTITAPFSSLRWENGRVAGGPVNGTPNPASTSPISGFDTRFTSGKSALAIPFELDKYNHIWLRVGVNGSPLSFILDTGGGGPYPTLSVRAAESLGMKLQFLMRKNNVGVGTKPTDFHIITDKTSLSLPGVEMSSRSMFAMSRNDCGGQAADGGTARNAPSDQSPKEETEKVMDGLLGMGFFSSFVVEIDYPARLINLYDPQSYQYTGTGKSFPLEMGDLIYVRAQVKAPDRPPVTARLAVDTGAATALTLNRRFAEEHKILPPPEKLTATNECGVGGMAEGTSYEGTLEALQLGDVKLSNPLTFFRKNPVGDGYDGLLGGGALRNFKVIFDYSRRRMILEPPSMVTPASPIKIEQRQNSSKETAQGAQQKPVTELQSMKAPQSTPTVDQILDRYAQATGGAAARRKLASRIMKTTLVIEGSDITANFESYGQAPNKAVHIGRFKLSDGKEIEVSRGFNGAVGWRLNPADGGFRELSGSALAAEKRDSEFNWEIKLKELYPKMALTSQTPVGDRLAYCIEATPTEGDPIKLYFDSQTGLLVRLDSMDESADKTKTPEETYFEDYREVDGVKLPFTTRLPAYKYTFKISEIRHNVPIEEAKFKSPDPADAALSAATTDEYLRTEMKKRRIPGLALAVIKNGAVVRLQGYGLANLEHEAPVTADTVFELASVTKQFTAAAIMRLAEQGKLRLDDPVSLRIPSAPAKWKGITIRHLLTHTSGLRGGFSGPSYDQLDITTDEVFRSVAEAPMNSAIGERFQYSDPGYFLLGMIIEKASGRRYRDFLAEEFFRPLEMTSTSIIDQWEIVRHRAAGYTIRNGQIINIRRIWQDEIPSHWGAISTVKDLAKWDLALASGRVVKEASLAEMWTPVKLNNGQSYPYGFGWKIENMGGRRVITHGGMSGTEFTRLPDDKLTVIVLTNLGYRYFDDVDSWGLTKGVARRYLSGLP